MFRGDCGDNAGNSDIIKTFGSSELTQSVYNLRMWIACTVLHRLEAEIVKTNKAFECRGFVDLKIGSVGLDRLKKTAENHQLVCMAPVLPIIVPFLEMSTNQEYLVRRINDLAKGCVLSEYRWNSGGNYNSLNWDEHLPTDSAVGTIGSGIDAEKLIFRFFFRSFSTCSARIWIVNYLRCRSRVDERSLIDMSFRVIKSRRRKS